jgi:class 3 adenylate cyclase/CHASE2 domain-containing sensor protein
MKLPWIHRPPRRLERQAVLLVAGMLAGALVFRGENFLERFFVDLRFSIASSLRSQETSEQIAVILMDRASEAALKVPQGPRWRQFHPDLVATLNQAGAALVVFDAMFIDEEKDLDPTLAAAFSRAGNVVAGEDASRPTIPRLRPSFLALGHLRIKTMGGVPRYVFLRASGGTDLQPLAMVAAEQFGKGAGSAAPRTPFPRSPGFWVNFGERVEYFPSFSYVDVLRAEKGRIKDTENTPVSVFTKKIVFIGLDDPASGDRFAFPNTIGRRYPGVFGQAFATDTIIRGRAVTRSSRWVDAGVALLFLAALILVLEIRSRSARTALLAVLPIGGFVACFLLLFSSSLWLGYAPLFAAFWAALLLHWIGSRMSLAASLRRAVGFDPMLIEAFRRESERVGGLIRKDVAILIADVRNYTSYVSRTDPSVVSRVMTEYMAAMERRITAQGGYVNKYIGDEIVAVFGFPLSAEQSTQRAVRAALGMLEELGGLIAEWKERGFVPFDRIGIGIDAGCVVFAEVGGKTKSQFDIIGDCINGASRIEQLTKDFRRDIIISEEAYRALENDDTLSGSFESLKSVAIRGQGERRIFGLL